jgi:YidC/Oxa1 family membrane protein insertase
MSSFPAGLLVGLVTTSVLTITQSLVLRNTAIRNALGIPIIPKGEHGKLPSFMDSVRFAREKWLDAANAK